MDETIIQKLYKDDNNIYIKREDLIPYSFGGNKARKGLEFFKEIDKLSSGVVITYGSASSNHARVIANLAYKRGIECIIVSPKTIENTFNKKMMKFFNAKVIEVEIGDVSKTIDKLIEVNKRRNKNPYFIQGGGHGNIGTKAYVDCYNEIVNYEKLNKIKFDYIFFASGTGTTQAGLVCGKILNNDKKNIIGISIARKNPYGSNVICKSVEDYFEGIGEKYNNIEENVKFLDDYILGGYGKYNNDIENIIHDIMAKYGIPLDYTYTGKAFFGMQKYLKSNKIKDKNILFIHTGGSPIFFDYLLDKG